MNRLILRADSGLAVGTIYPLPLNRNILGRSIEATIPVDDGKVSRLHAAVDTLRGDHFVVDLGSTNGTYLNGRRISGVEKIKLGDEIRIGSTVFKVEPLEKAKNEVKAHWREPTRAARVGSHFLPPPPAPTSAVHSRSQIDGERIAVMVTVALIIAAALLRGSF